MKIESHQKSKVLGLLAEFSDPQALIAAARAMTSQGFKKMDAHTPFPMHDLDEALDIPPTKLPWFVLIGGLTGLCLGFLLQYWTSAIDYPINIGGRPLNSVPAFVPICFEMTILLASFGAGIGMLIFNKLPQPYHPVFYVKEFERASLDRFFLFVDHRDAQYEQVKCHDLFKELKADNVYEVPNDA